MIEFVVDSENWTKGLPELDALVARCFQAAVQMEPDLDGEIALLLTDDSAIRALNHQFRGKDAPTNVLSFPVDEESPALVEGNFLGDIALAFETCASEVAERNILLADHAAHLIIHGMLHLIGYDHQTDPEAERMEAREREILAVLNINDPYTEKLEKTT